MVWQMRKKRLLGILLACILLIQPFSTQAKEQDAADEPDNLYAQSAVLMDADSGRVLFGKNENEAVRIRKCNEEESIYHRSFTENIPQG